ncbi:MAG: hypothetical protein JO053_13090 [Acidobacteria bacterium]|nr:hypothetical protein [Acidobacteriota bacterium]
MGVLLMLMTIGGLFVAVILLIAAAIGKKGWLAKFVGYAVAIWFAFYAVILLGFSLTSSEKVLAVGEAKEYCGFYLDCHMHTMVTGVRTARSIGDRKANGTFYIVGVKVFSDAKNPNIALRLLEPKARVVNPQGGYFERDLQAETQLPSANVRLDADIHHNEAINKEIVFDLPAGIVSPKLLITEGYGIDKTIEHVLPGDEDSLFHAQTFFGIREQPETAGVQ